MTVETDSLTPKNLGTTMAAINRLGGRWKINERKLKGLGMDKKSLDRVREELQTRARGSIEIYADAARTRHLRRVDFETAQTVFDALAADFETNQTITNDQHDAISQALEKRSQPAKVNVQDASLVASGLSLLGSSIAVAEQSIPAGVGGLVGGVLFMALAGADYLRGKKQERRPRGRHAA